MRVKEQEAHNNLLIPAPADLGSFSRLGKFRWALVPRANFIVVMTAFSCLLPLFTIGAIASFFLERQRLRQFEWPDLEQNKRLMRIPAFILPFCALRDVAWIVLVIKACYA